MNIKFFIGVYFLFMLYYFNEAHRTGNVATKFISAGIVPDVTQYAPDKEVGVTFLPSGKTVQLGNVLKPSEVQNIPELNYPTFNKHLYTAALIDPDAPSRQNPFERSFIHWLVGNVPGTHVDKGDTLVGYIGSAPPENTSYHRYTILVYRQTDKIKFNETIITTADFEDRKNFFIDKFAQKYGLGNAKMGNYYLCEHEG